MKIGIFTNPEKDDKGEVRRAVEAAARKFNVETVDYTPGVECNFVVSIGGDGTILRIAAECAKHEIPILGVNRGTVGFLTEIETADVDGAIENLVKRNYVLERRALLEVTLKDKKFYALNDAVIMRNGSGRVINVETDINGEKLGLFKCDGYIASTPTGSTAYSLSAGGPIVAPSTPAILLTPVSPHALGVRPIIVASGSSIDIKYVGGDNASLYVDGEEASALDCGDVVSVTGWHVGTLFVRFCKKSFYSRLTDKLNIR